MSKLERKNHKVFGINATETKVGQFGSANATTKITTKDVEKIQALDAWEQGWEAGAIGNNRYPTQQERTGVDYEHSYQIGYMLQEGIPEWNKDTIYNKGSIIKLVNDTKIVLYNSLQDNNKNHALTDTDYWEKVKLSGSGVELCTILCMPFGVDESENKYRYLNGQTIVQSQYPAFTAKVKSWQSTRASLFTTETDWQSIQANSKLGQCGKFVIDDEAGTIRLPAIININGLTDLSKAGLIKDESLPAHKHTRGTMEISGSWYAGDHGINATGAYYVSGSAVGPTGNYSSRDLISFKASRNWTGSTSVPDNATYQDDAPVQQEAVQYPYVICVNTGVEEAERPINNYQVNNPYSLFDSKYSDHKLNNLSWLRSEGQYNSGTIYNKAYELILKIYNGTETIEGISVKAKGDSSITDYDFVLNTANETFRLPLLDGSEDLISDKTITQSFTATNSGYIIPITKNGQISIRIYGNSTTDVTVTKNSKAVGTFSLQSSIYRQGTITTQVVKGDKIKVLTNASGTTTTCNYLFFENTGNGSLYYYVGDTLQNADLINIARMQEQITDINAQSRGYLVESYSNGTSGYRLYSDGYCEQWGLANIETYVTLLKTYRDTNYVILTSATNNSNSANRAICGTPSGMTANEGKSVNSFALWRSSYNANGVFSCYWETKGYLAVAQY